MGKRKESGRPAKKQESIEVSEDYCFQCKDGGDLVLCDRKNCRKAYHPDCIGKDESFFKSGQRWMCGWHRCSRCCKRSSDYRCYLCINAVCRFCISHEEFGRLRGSYGFCLECLELAKMVEEGQNISSDGEEIDFDDIESYEGLFKEYWEIIRKKEGLTLDDLKYAESRMEKGKVEKRKTYQSQPDTSDSEAEPVKESSDSESDGSSEKSEQKQILVEGEAKEETSDRESESNSEKSEQKQTSAKKRVCKSPAKHKKIGSNTREFVGWGSKPLIQFLRSIGKDTSQKISQDDACSIVIEYARDNKLFDPVKKKIILCDERLCTLLGRKYSSIYKVKDFLESHFAENIEQSDADDQVPSSDDEDEKAYPSASKLQKCSSSKRVEQKQSRLEDFQKKCDILDEDSDHSMPLRVSYSRFASITPENLKLVYLKRSLLEELSKQPECFKDKVIGSFVKVKSNAIDYKHAYRLLPVIDVKELPSDGTVINHCLTVASLQDDIRFSMLSNDDVIEEECEVLREKVENGLLERPTVVDLQKKAEVLHEDIMKRWIKRELVLLQHRIDHANEKGRRDLFFEYRQRKKLLETPEEQSRLLHEIPEVTADVISKHSNYDETTQNVSSGTTGEKSSPKEPL